MVVLTNAKIINMDQVKITELRTEGIMAKGPCIAFVLEFGDFIDRCIEVEFEDFPAAQEYFETLQAAISDGISVFDMRR